jgi:hypothetical protein
MTITKTISRIIAKITLNLASVLRNIKLGKIFKLGGGGGNMEKEESIYSC